jgi:hypothetical protein
MPEGHITDEADIALYGFVCFSAIGGVLVSAHIDAVYESEFSVERLLDSIITEDHNVLRFLG